MIQHDTLTSLPDQPGFIKYLNTAIERTKHKHLMLAVCLIDLNNFIQIYNSLGEVASEELLKHIPQRIKLQLRNIDYLAKISRDVFALTLESLESSDEVVDIMERIIKSMQQPIALNALTFHLSISIGIATYPAGGSTPEELINNATAAIAAAKEEGENTYFFFKEKSSTLIERQQIIVTELARAIERNEFSIVYQPQQSILTKEIVGLEALIRWKNSELNEVSPAEFIPIAEELGFVDQIGEWVLEKICQDYGAIKQAKSISPFIAFNISTKQLEHHRFVHYTDAILTRYHVPAEKIIFEVTETALIKHPEHMKKSMFALKNKGIQFMLDDFGVGYSSLQYLKKLPISFIKIDKSFIKNILHNENDAAIVLALIQLAHALNLQVIAEGVTSIKQFNFLATRRCDYVQGFYIAKPYALDELFDFLNTCQYQ